MKIGFTGTRSGMSNKQKKEVKKYMENVEISEVHHGMCVGADEDFHNISKELKVKEIHGRPGKPAKNLDDKSFRADVKVDMLHDEDTYFSRNRKIVNSSDIVLATPFNNNNRGGTWYTINYAKKVGKPVIIFDR